MICSTLFPAGGLGYVAGEVGGMGQPKKRVGKDGRSLWHRLSVVTRTTIIVLVLLLVGARLAMPYAVKRYVNHKLDSLPGYGGSIGDVTIHLLRGAYAIHRVNIVKETNNVPIPFVAANRVDFSVQWSELRNGALVGEVNADQAELHFVRGQTKEQDQTHIDKSWTEVVEDLFPFKINQFRIVRSAVWFHDLGSKPRVDVYVTNLNVVCQNITNSRSVTNELPTPFELTGTTLGGGKIRVLGRANPFEQTPRFDVDAAIEGMDLTALNDLLRAYANVDVKRGRMDFFTEMAAADGQFKGYVKPLVHDLDIVELKEAKNPLQFLWESFVAGVTKVFKNQPEDQLGARIPLAGRIDNPQAGLLPTIASVLRNAFVQALSPRVEGSVNIDQLKSHPGDRPVPKRDTSKD